MTHLLRAASLLALLLAGFLVLRGAAERVSLEMIGLSQGDNAAEWAALDPQIGSPELCQRCHETTFAVWEAAAHVGMPCATCHGPLKEHASTGGPIATTAVACTSCHAQLPSRPASFPQVDPTQHEPQATCGACHNPHAPAVASPAAKHPLEGVQNCRACHRPEGFAPLPPNHLDRPAEVCTGCHKSSPEAVW